MKRSLSLDFDKEGNVTLSTSHEVTGKGAALQAAIINMHTQVGSSPTAPLRGTDLPRLAAEGRLFSEEDTQHELNFAALETADALPDYAEVREVTALVTDYIGGTVEFLMTLKFRDESVVKEILRTTR